MIELKKSELEPILLTIMSINPETGAPVAGLLTETLTLGTKRKLQKIHQKVLDLYKELLTDVEEIKKECGEDKERINKEINELLNEVVKVDVEYIILSSLDNVSTKHNYSFDIIEKIAV